MSHDAYQDDRTSSGSTSSGLLRQIQLRDEVAWQRFNRLYTPLVYSWCRWLQVPAADAPDIVQDVFIVVYRRIDQFEHHRAGGSFRGWLWTITRNKILDYFRADDERARAVGGSNFQRWLTELPEQEPPLGTAASDKYGDSIYLRGLELVRAEFEPRTWQAFWRSAVDNAPTADVSQELGMSSGAVRKARFRVLRRLREELEGFTDEEQGL